MIFHDYIEEVRSLDKNSSLFLFIFKNSTFLLKKSIFLEYLNMFIYLYEHYFTFDIFYHIILKNSFQIRKTSF
jgi:hypothetical protein